MPSWLIFDVGQNMTGVRLNLRFTILGLLVLIPAVRAQELDDKEMMRRARSAQELASMLTGDDIPDEWRSRKSVAVVEGRTMVTHFRRGQKVLEVSWTDIAPALFAGTLYADGKKAGIIVRAADKVTVVPAEEFSGARLFTALRDDGILEVAIVRADASVADLVVVRGRESHILNDLDYAKGMILFDSGSWPMQERIRKAIEQKRPNKAPEPTPGSVTPRAIESKSK